VLRTNLSTKPFYNERAVHWGLGLALAAILVLTAFNVTRVLALSQQQSVLAGAAERDEAQAQALRTDAAALRASIDQKALERVIKAATEANNIIDQRTFSWTELLNHIERTLPPGVMLTNVLPQVDNGRVKVSLIVHGRSVENVDEFIDKMEGTRAFSEMSPINERITEGGLFEVTIVGLYHSGVAPEVEKSEASEKSEKAAQPDKKDGAGEAKPEEKPTPARPPASTPAAAAKRGLSS
jgi:Tfp pilus assembly protein PilN